MITKMSFADAIFFAVAITCARMGLPPISCRTLGCVDLSRVPLPAAMIAMAIRGALGVDRLDGEGFGLLFVLVRGIFAMLSQYTANQLRIACRSGACAISAIRSCATWSV